MNTLTVGGSLGLAAENLTAVHGKVLEGFPVSAIDRFHTESGLPKKVLHEYLGIPPRTLTRRRKTDRLTPDESDRLFRLAGLFARATELFNGDREAVGRWLLAPRPALGGVVPIELARTEVGARQVDTLIHKLLHGVIV